jgi:hypothetical protein
MTTNHSHLFFYFKGGLYVGKSEKMTASRKRLGIMNDVNLTYTRGRVVHHHIVQ